MHSMIVFNKTKEIKTKNETLGQKYVILRDATNVAHIGSFLNSTPVSLCKTEKQLTIGKPIRFFNPEDICSSCFYRMSKQATDMSSYRYRRF